MAWAASSFENVAKKLPESVYSEAAPGRVRFAALLWLQVASVCGSKADSAVTVSTRPRSKNQHTVPSESREPDFFLAH